MFFNRNSENRGEAPNIGQEGKTTNRELVEPLKSKLSELGSLDDAQKHEIARLNTVEEVLTFFQKILNPEAGNPTEEITSVLRNIIAELIGEKPEKLESLKTTVALLRRYNGFKKITGR